jgi:hypothetical protein
MRWCDVLWAAGAAICIAGMAGGAAAEETAGGGVPDGVFLISREELSSQATQPFLFLGEVMEPSHPQWSRYVDVLAEYPDVSSCLLEEERDKAVQDVRKLDWKAIDRNDNHVLPELDVCVYRIAVTLNDARAVRTWMVAQGYAVVDDVSTCSYSPGGNQATLDAYGYCSEFGIMAGSEFQERSSYFGFWRTLLTWVWLSPPRHTLNVQLQRDTQGSHFDVSATLGG